MNVTRFVLGLSACLSMTIATTPAEFLRIDGTFPGGGDCALFGSWEAQSATCVVQDASIAPADRLDVASATLAVVGTMVNDGLLVNDGTLLVSGVLTNANDLVNNWTGTMVVSGIYFSHFMYNFGSLTVEPNGVVDFDFFLENNGPLINHGTVRISATLFNIPERRIENLGLIEISAAGSVTNEGVFIQAGRVDNHGTIQNNASFVEHCDSEWTGNLPLGDAATGAQSITLAQDLLSWCQVPEALGYDVVSGDLSALRAGSGDFAVATTTCVADSVRGLSIDLSSLPDEAGGTWLLVRAEGVASADFDTVFSSQVGERGAEIETSGASCP